MVETNMYQEALDVQNASNLSGVAHSLANITSKVWAEVRETGGTEDVNKHPVIILFLDKMNQLAGLQNLSADSGPVVNAIANAYNICMEKAGK